MTEHNKAKMERQNLITNSENNENDIKQIIKAVYDALNEKGYDPISQIVGYLLTEDPTYITTHNNARSLIRHIDRFELLQILLKDYINASNS